MRNARFWQELDRLVAGGNLVVDRPRGSTHPRYPSFSYPLDYGYLAGTRSGDGEGIDVWIGSLPSRAVTGVVCTLDREKGDAEVKVLVGCTPAESETILAVHNYDGQSAILIEREGESRTVEVEDNG